MKIALSLLSGMSYGGRTYFGNLLPALMQVDTGNEYHLFVPSGYELPVGVHTTNVQIHHVAGSNKSAVKRLLWEQLILPIHLARRNIDVMYTAKNVNILLAPCKTVIAIRNVEPFYYKEHQNSWRLNVLSWIKWQLTKLSIKKADAIIAVSKNNKRLMAEYFPGTEKKTYVVYNGNPVRDVPDTGTRERFLLNASKFVAYANQLNLVEGYARLHKRRVDLPPLKFAGGMHDTTYHERVRDAVRRHGLEDQIEFLGLVPQQELFALYGRAHAFVFPSALESCPHTLIEVMTYGTPIAASNIEPMPEICEDAAIYFDPKDPEDVADALEHICFNKNVRARSSAIGRERHKKFTWEASARGLKDVFDLIYRPNDMCEKIPPHAKRVFEGIIFDTYHWEQEMFDGSIATFEAVRRSGTIQIIPTIGENIVLAKEEQPLARPRFTFVGGRQEEGEDPLDTAKRELREETGLASEDWELIRTYQPSSRKIDWNIYVYAARNCRKVGEQNLDAGEKINLLEVDFDRFVDIVSDRDFWESESSNDILRMKNEGKLDEYKRQIFGTKP